MHLSASLQGLITIRAAKLEDRLIKEFDNHQDIHSSVFYLSSLSIIGFGFWIDFLTIILIMSVLFGVHLTHSGMLFDDIHILLLNQWQMWVY